MQTVHKDLIHFVEKEIPFHRWLGIKVASATPGNARIRLPFRDEFRGNEARGAVHGGIVSTLVDVCGAVSLWSHFGPSDKTATIDMRVDYQRPTPYEDLMAIGEVRLLGNRIANVHVRVYTAKVYEQHQISSHMEGNVTDAPPMLAEGRCVYYVKRSDTEIQQNKG